MRDSSSAEIQVAPYYPSSLTGPLTGCDRHLPPISPIRTAMLGALPSIIDPDDERDPLKLETSLYAKPSPSSITPTRFQAQWLFFSKSRWIPLDTHNHARLERTLQLDGVFVDIQDSHFPDVQRIRVFPAADYLSYLGIRYRISRVLLPAP